MFTNIEIPDVLTVNLENRNINKFRNLISQTFLFLSMLHYISTEGFWSNRIISFIKRFDITIRVQFVLLLKTLECFNVLIERLYRLLKTRPDGIVSIPKPNVLIR